MGKNLEKNIKKGPKKTASKKVNYEQLLSEELSRHLNDTGRLDEGDVSRINELAVEFGADKALAIMDQIVLDKILADRKQRLDEYKDQRSGDIGFA